MSRAPLPRKYPPAPSPMAPTVTTWHLQIVRSIAEAGLKRSGWGTWKDVSTGRSMHHSAVSELQRLGLLTQNNERTYPTELARLMLERKT